MRRGWTVWAAVCALVVAAPVMGAEEDVAAQFEQMQKQLDAMEERLEATSDELHNAKERVEEQEELIRDSGLADPQGSDSSLSAFLDTIELGGWLSVSYWYNFNRPINDDLVGANVGSGGQAFPFHPDANQFSFDQLWFEMERPIDEENRAGFYAEFAFGKSAKLLPDGNAADGGNSLYIPQAYIQYQTPWGPTLKAGKFGTLIGYEVAQTVYNDQVSRGLVYNLLQPIDHVGLLLEGQFGESGFGWAAGIVNNVFKTQPVVNDNLAYTGRLSYTAEKWGIALNGIYGQVTGDSCGVDFIATEACDAFGIPRSGGDSAQRLGILDVVATFDPTEQIHLWANATYDWDDNKHNNGTPEGWGIAMGGRYAVTERWGAALRGEYVADDREYFGFVDDARIWSVTGTVDFAVTDQLTLKGEVRYDQGRIVKNDDLLYVGSSFDNKWTDDDQTMVGAELVYRF